MKKVVFTSLILLIALTLVGCSKTEDDIVINQEETVPYESYLKDTNPVVTIKVKDYGTMTLQLFPEVAPNSVRNMINLIENNYYEGLIFHRVIQGFMIQGGWGEESGCAIAGEFNSNGFNNPLKHARGVFSMARTMNPNSATSQFFIMHQNSPHLDGEYAGFGAMVSGFDVLDQIATTSTGAQDRPVEDIVITSMSVDTKGISYDAPTCYE